MSKLKKKMAYQYITLFISGNANKYRWKDVYNFGIQNVGTDTDLIHKLETINIMQTLKEVDEFVNSNTFFAQSPLAAASTETTATTSSAAITAATSTTNAYYHIAKKIMEKIDVSQEPKLNFNNDIKVYRKLVGGHDKNKEDDQGSSSINLICMHCFFSTNFYKLFQKV